MSQKNRRPRRRGFPLKYAALIAVGALLTGVAFLMFRGNNNGGGEVIGGTPAISVDPQAIDFGNLKDFTVKTFSIKVTNTGTGMLRFSGVPYVQVVDGCCPPALSAGKAALRPGESTTVTSAEFMMHPGMDGQHDFAVHIQTNDPAHPDLVVHVLSNWSQ